MRILVVAEGRHELGRAPDEGALVILVRRVLQSPAEFVQEKISDFKVRIHRKPGEPGGFCKRTLAWLRYAEANGFQALVLIVDEDGEQQRVQEIEAAQDDARLRLPRALGVAIRTFDAWMLADERAWSKAVGVTVNRQPTPERIRDPKRLCRNLLEESTTSAALSAIYAAVATHADISALERRCPKGFAG